MWRWSGWTKRAFIKQVRFPQILFPAIFLNPPENSRCFLRREAAASFRVGLQQYVIPAPLYLLLWWGWYSKNKGLEPLRCWWARLRSAAGCSGCLQSVQRWEKFQCQWWSDSRENRRDSHPAPPGWNTHRHVHLSCVQILVFLLSID